MKTVSQLRKSLQEMTIGTDTTASGKKVEWIHHVGVGHSVTVNDEPVHPGFVSREVAAKHYQNALKEDTEMADANDDVRHLKGKADELSHVAHMKSGELDSSSSPNDHLDALKAHAAAKEAHIKSSLAHGAQMVNLASNLAVAGAMDSDNLSDHMEKMHDLASAKNDSENEIARHDKEIGYHAKYINESVGDEAFQAILAEWGEPLSAIVKNYGKPGMTVHRANYSDENDQAEEPRTDSGKGFDAKSFNAAIGSKPPKKTPSEREMKQMQAAGKARIHTMKEGIEFEVHKIQTGLYVAELYDGEELVESCHAPTESGAIKDMERIIEATIKYLEEGGHE